MAEQMAALEQKLELVTPIRIARATRWNTVCGRSSQAPMHGSRTTASDASLASPSSPLPPHSIITTATAVFNSTATPEQPTTSLALGPGHRDTLGSPSQASTRTASPPCERQPIAGPVSPPLAQSSEHSQAVSTPFTATAPHTRQRLSVSNPPAVSHLNLPTHGSPVTSSPPSPDLHGSYPADSAPTSSQGPPSPIQPALVVNESSAP